MNEKLIVLWTTRDVEVAMNMAFMYAKNSKIRGWWKDVELVIWGPSAEVAVNNVIIQNELKEMQNAGVKIKACIACANRYGVTENLRDLGIEVISMGLPLTEELKAGTKLITV